MPPARAARRRWRKRAKGPRAWASDLRRERLPGAACTDGATERFQMCGFNSYPSWTKVLSTAALG